MERSSRIYLILVIVLALLNVSLLVYVLSGRGGRPHPPRGGGNTGYFLESELQLSQEQKKKYREMREIHFDQVHERHEEIRTLKEEFFDLLGKTGERDKALAIAKQIGEQQAAIEMLTWDHFNELRAICTPEQQEKFDEVIQDALRMGPPPPGGPPGRPPR